MADISNEVKIFREAVYGEEVRGGFISLAEKMNEVSEATEAAEKNRVTAETGRVNAEKIRVSQETARKNAETDRVSAETARASAESTRTSQESTRKSAETARGTAETGRANAEKTRVAQEEARKTAETARAGAESTRVSQEKARASAETSRANAEKARGTAETGRVNAEQKRQTDTGSAIESCNTATDRANKAAKAAEDVVAGKGFIPANEKGAAGGVAQLDDNGKVPAEQMADIGKLTSFFSEATVRVNLKSGETLDVSLGKIAKWFADLQPHAFETPVRNLTTTVAGKALDATIAKQINDDLSAKFNLLNSTLPYFHVAGENTFVNNFLAIDPSTPNSVLHQASIFSKVNNGEWKNIPSQMSEGTVIGVREVVYKSHIHVLVKITEFYPIAGKQYFVFYNTGNWTEWKVITPS